jgi:hypothetical protein
VSFLPRPLSIDISANFFSSHEVWASSLVSRFLMGRYANKSTSLLGTTTSGYIEDSNTSKTILTMITGTHGSAFLWLHLRRMVVRYVPLYWREPHQHSMGRSRASDSPNTREVVYPCNGKIRGEGRVRSGHCKTPDCE